jgi:Regulator of ribonuclease activity B
VKAAKTIVGILITLALASCDRAAVAEKKTVSGQSYGECIRKVLSPSFAIMERMEAQGLDLNKPRTVTHLLVGPQEKIALAADSALKQGHIVLEQANRRLLIAEDVPIIEDWIKHTIPVFCSLAAEYGLTYDGWDVDVSKDGLKRD